MMRILLLVYNMVGRGTYRRAYQFGKHLALRGHAVTLIATSPDQHFRTVVREVEGLTLVESPDLLSKSLRSGWDPWNTIQRIKWIAGQDYDIAHLYESRPTVIFPGLYKKSRGLPLVMDWADWFGRGGSVEERKSALVRTILRPVETYFEENFRPQARGATVICTTLRDKAVSLGTPPEKILLLPNGSDIEHFFPKDPLAARRRLNLPEDVLLVGYIGSVFYQDAVLMARAFDEVYKAIRSARLLIIGACNVDIRQLVQQPAAVVQTGIVKEDDLNDYLNSCNVCWLPLNDTGANRGRWPLKLNDYMAAGKPVVATGVGDVVPVIEEHGIGLLSPVHADMLAQQAIQLLQNPALAEAMGRNARRTAEDHFNWGTLTGKLECFYQSILSPGTAPRTAG